MTDAQSMQASIGIAEVLQLMGLSAVISGGLSALVTYLLNSREFGKRRHSLFIDDKIDVYSYCIYHLDAMLYKGEALKLIKKDQSLEPKYVYSSDELEKTINYVDDKIRDKYYLLTPDILKAWVHVKTIYGYPEVKEQVDNLRELLVREYNDVIVPEYEKVVGGKLKRIGSLTNNLIQPQTATEIKTKTSVDDKRDFRFLAVGVIVGGFITVFYELFKYWFGELDPNTAHTSLIIAVAGILAILIGLGLVKYYIKLPSPKN